MQYHKRGIKKVLTIKNQHFIYLKLLKVTIGSLPLSDKELLKQYKQVEQLNQEDKHLVKTFIDAFLTKRQLQQLAQ